MWDGVVPPVGGAALVVEVGRHVRQHLDVVGLCAHQQQQQCQRQCQHCRNTVETFKALLCLLHCQLSSKRLSEAWPACWRGCTVCIACSLRIHEQRRRRINPLSGDMGDWEEGVHVGVVGP